MKTKTDKTAPASVTAEGFTFTREGSRIVVTESGTEQAILPAKMVRDLAAQAAKAQALKGKVKAIENQIDELNNQIRKLESERYEAVLESERYEAVQYDHQGFEFRIGEDFDGSVDFGCTNFPAEAVKKVAALAASKKKGARKQ